MIDKEKTKKVMNFMLDYPVKAIEWNSLDHVDIHWNKHC